MVAWLNISVSQVDQDLKKRIADVDLAVKTAKDEREKLSLERDFHFKVYELVQRSIEDENEKKQAAARAFVLVMVEGDLRKHLLGVLESGGTPAIREETRIVIAQEAAFESDDKEIVGRERAQTPSFNWEDWDYDIFWCSASGDIAKRQANLVSDQLKAEGAKGRIRVRELPNSVNAKSGYQISGYAIRRNANEAPQAEALRNLSETVLSSKGFASKFQIGTTRQDTPWYVSAFLCP